MISVKVSLILVILSIVSLSSMAINLPWNGDLSIHDPSFIKAGPCYYGFSTGEPPYKDGNIIIRSICNDRVTRVGAEFERIPEWISKTINNPHPLMWAPDINFINGEFYLYYASSSMGSQNSVIALATSKSITGPWIDRGEVYHTHNGMSHNAIDPEIAWTFVNGQRHEQWLIFGSGWEGIKMRKLDMHTGKLATDDTKLYSLASRGANPQIEASSSCYRDGWYYLFVSFDFSNYRTMVGRSRSITGPYVDRNGVDMMKGGGTQILASHENILATGGEDIYVDNGIYRMIYHYYDANAGRAIKFDIVDLIWTPDQWPTVGPTSKLNYH